MKSSLLVTFVLFLFLNVTQGAKILLLSPMGSKSHKIFYMGIVNVLAERGHEVTIVSGYKNSKDIKNVRDIVIPTEEQITQMLSNIFDKGAADHVIKDLMTESPRLCSQGLANKEVQDLRENKYDIVILSMFFSNCYISLIHHFKVPFIYISPAGLFGPFNDMIGNIDVPSIVANKLLEGSFPLRFSDRFITALLNSFLWGISYYYMLPKMESQCKEMGLCPLHIPAFEKFNENASFAIINVVRSLEFPPRPTMPNVIYAGGAHIRPGKPLSQDLEKWVQGSGDAGFIFFSLGSAVTPSHMPEKYRKTLVKVFGTLKQRVLWKWDEETMPDLPSNVKLGKWLPQQDILAHSRLKLFISHGGSLSTMEATYHGIPVLGMPVFADQFSNMKDASNEGWAKVLQWGNLNESALQAVINEILSDDSLREVSKKRSAVMKDRLVHPADEAAYWIEYTIRHKGAEHLRSPVFKLKWYELYNVDVWAVITFIILLVAYIFFLIFRTIIRFCFAIYRKVINTDSKKKKD